MDRSLLQSYSASAQGQGSFRVELFSARSLRVSMPHAELLYVPPNGMDAEEYFSGLAATPGLAVQADIDIFPRAARLAQLFEGGGSVNVQAPTLFDSRFLNLLDCLHESGVIDPRKVWIEMTEQMEIPEQADLECLDRVRAMGYRVALDDLNIADDLNMARLGHVGEHMDMLKFSYKTMQALRGNESRDAFDKVRSVSEQNTGKLIVMEGVQMQDCHRYQTLWSAGVQVFQFFDPAVSRLLGQADLDRFALRS